MSVRGPRFTAKQQETARKEASLAENPYSTPYRTPYRNPLTAFVDPFKEPQKKTFDGLIDSLGLELWAWRL